MKKVILSLALAAFAMTLQAGDTNQSANAAPPDDKPKACCPADGGCCAKEKAKDSDKAADAAKPAEKKDK